MEESTIDFRFLTYLVTDRTLYIRATQQFDAVSEVIELEDTCYIMQDSQQIIDDTCIYYGSSYQGRATSVKKTFDLKQNPPIPLDPAQDLYAFPTHSPRRQENIWVITKNIKAIEPRDRFSIIYYKNGVALPVPLSRSRMEKVFSNLYKYYLYFR